MTDNLRRFLLKEDGGAAGGASSAGATSVVGGVAGTSGNPPVSVGQQKKYRRGQITGKIGLIKAIPTLK